MKILRAILLVLFFSSCTNQASETWENRIDDFQQRKGIEAESLLIHTQQIYQHYTAYLTSQDINSRKQHGKRLVGTLSALDTLDYQNSPCGIVARINIDSTDYIHDIYLQTDHGIAWEVKFDSLMNTINQELQLIKYKDF